MTGLRAYHRANSNTAANTVQLHENGSDIGKSELQY
jgi:hypothetical protein